MTDRINKFNHSHYSYKYIRRLMKILKIKARIRQKKCNRIKIKPEQVGENILKRDYWWIIWKEGDLYDKY